MPLDVCDFKCDSFRRLFSHLKIHIREGRQVSCPFANCGKLFTVISTFSSHLSRSHKPGNHMNLVIVFCQILGGDNGMSEREEESLEVAAGSEGQETNECGAHWCEEECKTLITLIEGEQAEVNPESTDEPLFLKNLALFYLKLQAKLLLPSAVIQSIIEDMQAVHDVNQCHLWHKLSEIEQFRGF